MKKSERKDIILKARDKALEDVYHNATLNYPNEWYGSLSDKEWELVWDEVNFIAEFDIQNLSESLGLDRLYTWGRGGRTVAPKEWVKTYGGSSFRVKDAEDFELSIGSAFALLLKVRELNEEVALWCSAENLREIVWPRIEEYREEKKAEAKAYAALLTI